MLFLMRYAGVKIGDEPDFFANYYPPAWSILYWLNHDDVVSHTPLKKGDIRSAVAAQAMAMFLHSLDDHLVDGQVSVTPLTLLLRSQAWAIMNGAFCNLSQGVPSGEEIVQSFLGDYYSSNQDSEGLYSLDTYCSLFRRQMAIGMITPILLSMKLTRISDFAKDIEVAYGSFGIAWRLLDDIRDIGEDIQRGAESSVCLCLPEELRTQWKRGTSGTAAAFETAMERILVHVLEQRIIDHLKERICTELDAAACTVEAYNMTGLAREFRCLADPLRESMTENQTARSPKHKEFQEGGSQPQS